MKSDQIDKMKKRWQSRFEHQTDCASGVAEILKTKSMTIYRLALILGARASEIGAFLNLNALCTEAKSLFESHDLPTSFAYELVELDKITQVDILRELCNNASNDEIVLRFGVLIQNKKRSFTQWKELLDGNQLCHLSSKAKSYDVLSKKNRRALYQMGRLIANGNRLSLKQRRYLDSILDQCVNEKLISDACFKTCCNICESIAKLRKESDAIE